MTFSDPRWLWALAALPVLLAIEWRAARRAHRALRALVGERGDRVLLAQRLPRQRALGIALRLVAIALLALGAAGPEWGREVVRRPASGADVLFVVDVSASMDARDVPPTRLDEARREALALLERLGGSRVGVLAFAGDAVRLCPLTLDLGAARLTLESLSSGSVSAPGSDLGRALRKAATMMPAGRRDEQIVVLWTDGEDLEGGAAQGIEALVRAGIRVFAVGVGTAAGDVVPVLDDQGRAVDVKRDEAGGPVVSRLDQDALRDLGRRTRGGYFAASRAGGELPRLIAAVSGVGRSARGERLIERPVARFALLGALAALLLAVELRRPRRRREDAAGVTLHSERAGAATAALLALALAPEPAAAQSDWARGDRAFRDGRYAAAESLYARRARGRPIPELGVNRATALAELGRAEEAERALEGLVDAPGRAGGAARYNLGTARGRRGDLDGGLAALRAALERDPADADARWNYEVLLRRREARDRAPEPDPSGGGGDERPEQGGETPRGSDAPDPAAGGPDARPLPQSPQPRPSAPERAPEAGQAMTREQAERILGALEQMSRLEQQRQRRVRVVQERRGRDW